MYRPPPPRADRLRCTNGGRGLCARAIGIALWFAPSALAVTFHPPALYELSGTDPTDIAVLPRLAGAPDLVVAMSGLSGGDGKIDLQMNDGAGRFTDHPVAVPYRPYGLAVADWSGDALPDLAVAEAGGGENIHLYRGDGAGGLIGAGSTSSGGSFAAAIAAGDFNADGWIDLMVGDAQGGGISLLPGAGTAFGAPQSVPEGLRWRVIALRCADFDRDGRLDVAAPQGLLRAEGDGRFSLMTALGGSQAVSIADFDGDGFTDVAAATTEAIQIVLQNGASFTFHQTLQTPSLAALASADLDRDGVIDLLSSSPAEGTVRIMRGVGEGSFMAPQPLSACVEPGPLTVADLNADGHEDIATACRGAGETAWLAVFLQDPTAAAPLPILRFAFDRYTVPEGGTLLATLIRSDPASFSRVRYATEPGSAQAGRDYTEVSGVLDFTIGVERLSVAVPIADDREAEGDEQFTIRLTHPEGAVLKADAVPVTITDNDPSPEPTAFLLLGSRMSVFESAGSVSLVVARTGGNEPATIDFWTEQGTARADIDYTPTSGSLLFPGGAQQQTITVPIRDDGDPEPDEIFTVHLTGNSPIEPALATLTLLDDDAPLLDGVAFDSTNVQVSEDESMATLTLVRRGTATTTLAVAYRTVDGTARHPQDYQETSGTITFQPGEQRIALPVALQDDPWPESEETFTVQLLAPDGQVSAEALVTIGDTDGLSATLPTAGGGCSTRDPGDNHTLALLPLLLAAAFLLRRTIDRRRCAMRAC